LDISVAFSPIYHPQSNSVAERSVQICKKLLKKLESSHPKASISDWQTILSKFLFAYLNTPSTTLGKSPNQVLLSFSPRTPLSNLHPKHALSTLVPILPFKEGDYVLIRIGAQPVLTGQVVRALSASRYLVSVEGILKTVHVNQMAYSPQF